MEVVREFDAPDEQTVIARKGFRWYGPPPPVMHRRGEVVLCVDVSENKQLGITIIRFLHAEKLYTLKGYFIPQEYFCEVAPP